MMGGMSIRSRLSSLLVVFALVLLAVPRLSAQAYVGRPKLIVIVVIDQFRADYLNRDETLFKGRGFRLFMDEGAWFTDCYYDYANTKTAPGHATIGTGAYTDGHGIESNEFWDAARSMTHQVTSVEDERYELVDLPASSIPANQPGAPATALGYVIGSSPRNLRATTLGDELRLATQGRARVYGISLKDRAAILPAGQSANGAFWIDPASGQFTTSTYYMEHLPEWARVFNASDRRAEAEREAKVPGTKQFFAMVGRTPAANRYELDFAKALIKGEKLGQNGVTDLLVVSLSANDIQGHQFGPDSLSEQQMILSLDQDLGGFFGWLDQNIGLKNMWLALTADHGIAPIPGEAAKLGIDSATVDTKKLYVSLNAELSARFSYGKPAEYLLPGPDLPYIVLNSQAFRAAGVDEKTAENAVAEMLPGVIANLSPHPDANTDAAPALHRLPPTPQVAGVYTRLEFEHGQLPPSEWGRLLAHSYADHGNWFVMLVLGAYQMGAASPFGGTTHFSPWSYDRHVPLAFYGEPFASGAYHQKVAPVDLAVTFSSLLGINRPSAAVGHVLTMALKPASPGKN